MGIATIWNQRAALSAALVNISCAEHLTNRQAHADSPMNIAICTFTTFAAILPFGWKNNAESVIAAILHTALGPLALQLTLSYNSMHANWDVPMIMYGMEICFSMIGHGSIWFGAFSMFSPAVNFTKFIIAGISTFWKAMLVDSSFSLCFVGYDPSFSDRCWSLLNANRFPGLRLNFSLLGLWKPYLVIRPTRVWLMGIEGTSRSHIKSDKGECGASFGQYVCWCRSHHLWFDVRSFNIIETVWRSPPKPFYSIQADVDSHMNA